jgi:hypothetical protein
MSRKHEEPEERGDIDFGFGPLGVLLYAQPPEFAEQVKAAQREKDIWKPVSPAIAKRIDAAMASWESIEGRRFVEDVAKRTETTEEEALEKLNDQDCLGSVSLILADLEEYLVTALEIFPPEGECTIHRDLAYHAENRNVTIATLAVVGLAQIASCRRNIGAGKAAAAAFQLMKANEIHRNILSLLLAETHAPLLKKARSYKGGHKRSTTTKRENTRERDLRWLRDDQELKRKNPHWGRTGRARHIAEMETKKAAETGGKGTSYSTVLKRLKPLREEESGSAADS